MRALELAPSGPAIEVAAKAPWRNDRRLHQESQRRSRLASSVPSPLARRRASTCANTLSHSGNEYAFSCETPCRRLRGHVEALVGLLGPR
jgi:hypothetical protein